MRFESVNKVGCVGQLVDRNPLVIFRTETFPFHIVLLVSLIPPIPPTRTQNLIHFPFFVSITVLVLDKVWEDRNLSDVGVVFGEFEISYRDNWMYLPIVENIQCISKSTNRMNNAEWADLLLTEFMSFCVTQTICKT